MAHPFRVFFVLALWIVACGDESGTKSGPTAKPTGGLSKPVDQATPPVPQPKPKPVARLTTEQAQALLDRAAAEAAKGPSAQCAPIMKAVNRAGALVGPTTKANQSAFLAAAICAERNKKYHFMLWTAAALAKTQPESLKLGIIPRAFMHLEQPKKALEALKAIDKRYPNAPGVLFAGMLLANHEKNWGMAIKLAKPTVQALLGSEYKGVAWEAAMIYARALLTTGKLEEADKAIAGSAKLGAPPAVLRLVKKKLIPVRKTKVYVDPSFPKKIYLGTYHLYGKADVVGDLFKMHIANLTGADQAMKVELEIPGVTDRVVKSVNLTASDHETVQITPPLTASFNPGKLQAERNAQVHVKVSLTGGGSGDVVVFEESIETRLFPRDQLPLATNTFIPAWITPQAPAVEALLTAAKKRAPGKNLAGALAATVPQMRALYEELKARGMSYVLVTNFGLEPAQHARLPTQTIESTNALCLDGAVLFATLAEKLGLRPVLVRVPGHIFFGWHAGKGDNAPPGTIYFLETTMVGSHSFEDAMKAGQMQFARQKQLGGFKTGQASVIDVIELRQAGITPQPWG